MRHFAVQMRIVLVVRFAVLAVSFAAIPRHQSNRPFDFLVPVHMQRTKKFVFKFTNTRKKWRNFQFLLQRWFHEFHFRLSSVLLCNLFTVVDEIVMLPANSTIINYQTVQARYLELIKKSIQLCCVNLCCRLSVFPFATVCYVRFSGANWNSLSRRIY